MKYSNSGHNFFADITMSDPNFIITEKFYMQVVCFLTFNVSAMLGSLTTSWIQWVSCSSIDWRTVWLWNKINKKKHIFSLPFVTLLLPQPKKEYLIWPVLLRAVFIPLFMFCNYHPVNLKRIMPIYINNDWTYWGIAIAMAYSSGYLR